MQFKELRLDHFGKFDNRSVILTEGINLIYGANESGKSTIHSFIRGMLYGIEKTRGRSSKEDLYLKYQPWDNNGSYGGSMDINTRNNRIRLTRNFDKNYKQTQIIDLDTGRELDYSDEGLIHLFGGLTEAGYQSTISIEQLKAKTGKELADLVRNYITNLSLSKTNEVDVTKALKSLQSKKKELEAKLSDKMRKELEEEINRGLTLDQKVDQLNLSLKKVKEEEGELLKICRQVEYQMIEEGFLNIEDYETYLEQLPVIYEKYKNYSELKDMLVEFTGKIESLTNQLQSVKEKKKSTEIATAMEQFMESQKLIQIYEKEKAVKLLDGSSKMKMEQRKLVTISLSVAFIGILLILLNLANFTPFGIMGIFLILLGAGVLAIGGKKKSSLLKELEEIIKSFEDKIQENSEKQKQILLKFNARDNIHLNKVYEEQLRAELDASHTEEKLEDYQKQSEVTSKSLERLKQEIISYIKHYPEFLAKSSNGELLLCDKKMEEFYNFISSKKESFKVQMSETKKEQEELRIQAERLRWELSTLEGNEEELIYNKHKYEELLESDKKIKLDIQAINMAIDTISQLSVDIHDSFGRKLNDLVSNLTGEVTNGKYTDIKIDEKLDIKALHGNRFVTLDKLSTGTIEQLYTSLRICVADLLYGETMPLLFDDSFAYYDDSRVTSVLNYLARSKRQVLIFTCHNREKSILDAHCINYNYIDLSTC